MEVMGQINPDESFLNLQIKGLHEIQFPSARPVTNAGFESAAINIRAIFYFLGLGVDEKSRLIIDKRGRLGPTDIIIEDCGGKPVTASHFEATLKRIEPVIGNTDIAISVIVASKAVAHLTRSNLPALQIEHFRAACHCTNVVLKEALASLGYNLHVLHTLRRPTL